MLTLTTIRAAFARSGLSLMLFGACLSLLLPGRAGAGEFTFAAPQCITAQDHPTVLNGSDPYYLLDNYRMSRNPNTQLAFDTSGTLHLTYWSGFFATNPSSPAAVYYRNWSERDGWSEQQIVDDSYNEVDPAYLGVRMGGRHPSLCVDTSNTVWIAWHDHRDCRVAPPYNGINDIEVYCDHKAQNEEWFSGEDVRLTDTTSDGIDNNVGDNAYCARIQSDPLTNKKTVLWYDFHADGWFSDIFMLTSDKDGTFSLVNAGGIMSQRLTDADTREPVPPQTLKPAFNMPDFIITPEGQRYAVWSQDFGGSVGNSGDAPIYFAEIPEEPALVSYTTLVGDNDGYWYPPKLKLAPNGDLWVAYTVLNSNYNRDVRLLHRSKGHATFDAPIILTDGTKTNSNSLDITFDVEGRVHAVWIENGGNNNHQVRYAQYNPDSPVTPLRSGVLTPQAGGWEQPCIVLNTHGLPYIIFADSSNDAVGHQGDIWFVRGLPPPNAASNWNLYE
jgi:hypothetical protein